MAKVLKQRDYEGAETGWLKPEDAPAEIRDETFFERVPMGRIFVHHRTEPGGYARPPLPRKVERMVKEFDPKGLGCLLFSMRDDGRFALLDGQHRWLAARQCGLDTVPGFVYIDLSVEQEARLYRRFGEHTAQTPIDRFHAALREGKPEETVVARVLAGFGLRVPQLGGQHAHGVAAADTLMRITRTYGVQTLQETLRILNAAFDGRAEAYSAVALQGTAAFWLRYHDHPQYRWEHLTERIEQVGLGTLAAKTAQIREALGHKAAYVPWGKALLQIYNAGRGPKLPAWQEKFVPEDVAARSTAIRVAKLTGKPRRGGKFAAQSG